MSRVALFSSNFLEYSQTFIYEELIHHARYQAEVFTRRLYNQDRFAYAPVHIAGLPYWVTRYSHSFHREFRSGKFDVIHAHFGPGALYAVPYAKKHALPLVVTFHGYDVPLLKSAERFAPKNWPYTLLSSEMLKTMTLGLCASNELLQMLVEFGVPESKLRLYHLGVDLQTFKPAQKAAGPCAVVMLGRMVEKKGFSYGIRAFAKQVKLGADATLSIIGKGELQESLQNLVATLGIAKHVSFLGTLDKEQIAAHMAQAHVLLAPSVVALNGNRESGVIAIKEACACGVVPIGTYHGGIPEIIDHGETGFLVPERNVDLLSEHLGTLITNAPLRENLARAARTKMCNEYDAKKQVVQLEALYDEAIRAYAAGRAEH